MTTSTANKPITTKAMMPTVRIYTSDCRVLSLQRLTPIQIASARMISRCMVNSSPAVCLPVPLPSVLSFESPKVVPSNAVTPDIHDQDHRRDEQRKQAPPTTQESDACELAESLMRTALAKISLDAFMKSDKQQADVLMKLYVRDRRFDAACLALTCRRRTRLEFVVWVHCAPPASLFNKLIA
jgi:hypothetical protein